MSLVSFCYGFGDFIMIVSVNSKCVNYKKKIFYLVYEKFILGMDIMSI